jgi:hypothetical protein
MELNWENAKEWIDKSNTEYDFPNPKWKFDCGFKLDYDGSIISISSRFYPPHRNSTNVWEGKVAIYIFQEKITEKDFTNHDLDCLKEEVENFIKEYKENLKAKILKK